MKVLFIHCAYQYRGGEDTVVDEEIKLLKAAGVQVELLLFSNEKNALLNVLQLPFNLSSYRKTRRKLKRFLPDVVHIHNLHFAASPSVIYAVKKQGIPMVCTLHNYRLLCPSATLFDREELFLDSLHQTFPFEAVKRGVYKRSKLLTLWLAISMQLHRLLGTWRIPNKLIVLSRHAETIFKQSKIVLRQEQLVQKPNFVPKPATEQLPRTADFLYVGRLSPEKGLPLLLRAFSEVPHNLVIAGDGPLKEEVVTFSEKHPNIRYVGALPKKEVYRYMQTASALVFPSIWFEGMPLTIIEAFACGTPVLASKLGAMEVMVTQNENGLLFDPGEEQALKKAIADWAALPVPEKEIYSARALATYHQLYTPDENQKQLLTIYASLQKRLRETLQHVNRFTNVNPPAVQTP